MPKSGEIFIEWTKKRFEAGEYCLGSLYGKWQWGVYMNMAYREIMPRH